LLGEGHWSIYKGSYSVSNIAYLNSLPPTLISFIYPLLIPGTVSTGIIFSFMYMCIHYLHHSHPPAPFPTTSPTSPHANTPVLQFCIRKYIKDMKNMAFLLVRDDDIYTGRFLVLLPCTCILQSTLVHLYQSSSLFLSHLPIVALASLRLLYSLLYSEHINQIQVLGFLPLLSLHLG
jgi:hypothetical protein